MSTLNCSWFASIVRAIILVPASFGYQLSFATLIYSNHISPFFDAHAQMIEQHLQTLRARFAEFNDGVCILVEHALRRLAEGGLLALVSLPSASQLPAAFQSAATSDRRNTGSGDSLVDSRLQKDSLPQLLNLPASSSFSFPVSRPTDSVDSMTSSIRSTTPSASCHCLGYRYNQEAEAPPHDPWHATIRPTILDLPKPNFENARAIRRRFRQRSMSSITNKALT